MDRTSRTFKIIPVDEWAHVINAHIANRPADAYESRRWFWYVLSPLEKCENCGADYCIFTEHRNGRRELYQVKKMRVDESLAPGNYDYFQTQGRMHLSIPASVKWVGSPL